MCSTYRYHDRFHETKQTDTTSAHTVWPLKRRFFFHAVLDAAVAANGKKAGAAAVISFSSLRTDVISSLSFLSATFFAIFPTMGMGGGADGWS